MGFLRLFLVGLAAAIVTTAADGEDLLPELAPSALAHKNDSALLAQQKIADLESAKKPYLKALDEADRAATATGNVAAVREIAREREAVAKGKLPDSFPEGLPKSLATARKTFVRSSEKVLADIGARQKALDTTYLRFLATLQPKAAKNAKLGAQVAAEKEKLLEKH